ncbi:hypothetical protein [cf. Phormidesmis sp. LEGE 11477]|uniref:hypothetical protein n=1 Tax=cf. Phormidesmis sp. LEGE 11477 TaxID=1828680 RepID=UPI00187F9B2D|nr:hypothetical protein [cf. Phormidesmis sp. LEGE 11477]MBE9059755.1 hypothetical protein [cf. Phormidesmis sp. LEGE 11477]
MPYSITKSVSMLALSISVVLPAVLTEGTDTESAIAQTTLPTVQTEPSFRQLLKRIFRDDEWEDPPTISRGELCLLAPARPGEETRIWHQSPVFVWRGELAKMAVVDSVSNAVMWEYEPTPEQTSVRYAGEPLQAGRSYVWQVYDEVESDAPTVFPPFEVMSDIQRWLIGNGLAIAESRVERPGAEIARMEYFAQRGLPTDALQSLFLLDPAIDIDDTDTVEAQQETVDRLCE